MTEDEEYILVRGKRIKAVSRDIPHEDLRFWPDNPRVYSLLDRSASEPDQDVIFERMKDLEHVRELRIDISENGGLIDPVIVRGNDHVVVEGNSRLAAYRLLADGDPVKWEMMRCRVLPEDTTDADIYAMLGQYHVRGKKDWAPYERAGFVYRRHTNQKLDIPDLARELGISQQQVRHFVVVFQFMKDKRDGNRERWSHYDEFLKSRKIRDARKSSAHFEDRVVALIKSDEVRAVDVRDRLPKICGNPRILKKFANGELDFEDACEDARHAGSDSTELAKVKRFGKWLGEPGVMDDIVGHNRQVRDKIEYQFKKIERRISTIRKQLEESKKSRN